MARRRTAAKGRTKREPSARRRSLTRFDLPIPVKGGREYAERLVQSVIARRRRIAQEFYGMGMDLRELSRPQIYGVLGFASFGELLERRTIINRMTAQRLMSVVEAFPIGMAMKLGVEKAYALVRYVEATPAPDVARELAVRDAVIEGKAISEITVREIVTATKRVKGEGAPDATDPNAKEAKRAAKALQTVLRKSGAKRVTARGAWERGAWRVRLEMTVDEARAVVARL